MFRPATAAIGAAMSTWPMSVIETQPLNVSFPSSSQRYIVRRYDQSSLLGMPIAP